MEGKHVFVSHSTEDAYVANHIVERLERAGVSCWIAPRDVWPSSIYAEEIDRGLRESSRCAVVLSDAANKSVAVKRELELASHYRKPFFVIRLKSAQPGPGLNYYLQNTQWFDYGREGDEGLVNFFRSAPPVALKQWSRKRVYLAPLIAVAVLGIVGISSVSFFSKRDVSDERSISDQIMPSKTMEVLPKQVQPPSISNAVTPKAKYFPNSTEAPDFCSQLNRIAAEAEKGFSSWKEQAGIEQGDGSVFFDTSQRLPGSAHCAVSTTPPWSTPSYVCFWDTKDAITAQKEAALLLETIRTCPKVVRGVGGRPAIGDVQFEANVLKTNANVITLSAANARAVDREAANARSRAPRFPNDVVSFDFCSILGRAATELEEGFASWRRDRKVLSKGASWASSFRMPGAEFCIVTETQTGEMSLVCYWNTTSAADAGKERDKLLETIRSCKGVERGARGDPRIGEALFTVGQVTQNPEVVTLMVWKPSR